MRRSLVLLKPCARAAVRIFCFPYAGGAASFARTWPEYLPAHAELIGVQYPGRDSRYAEPLSTTPQAIVDSVFQDIARYTDLPLMFVGYSLGALVAYEAAIKLMLHGLLPPAQLVVAAARAPHLARNTPALSTLPDPEFIAKLRKFGGTPESVLQDDELMRHFLPILRADFACAENYRRTAFPPLPCPITALHGSADDTVEESAVADWKMHTSRGFALHRLEGGHFFLQERLDEMMSIINHLAELHPDDEVVRRTSCR
jgi:medium-chain acyl-[acyl-carrier-protein] hydrolase